MSILTTLESISTALTNLNTTLQGMSGSDFTGIINAINAVEDAIGGNWNPDDNTANFVLSINPPLSPPITGNWVLTDHVISAMGLNPSNDLPIWYIEKIAFSVVAESSLSTGIRFFYQNGTFGDVTVNLSSGVETVIYNPNYGNPFRIHPTETIVKVTSGLDFSISSFTIYGKMAQ